MKTSIWLAGAMAGLFAGSSFAFTDVSVDEVKEMIDSGAEMVLLDVREDWEYEEGHIPGTVHLPWNSGVLQEQYGTLPKDRPIVVICRSGNRSRLVSAFLEGQGFDHVLNVVGGMLAWEYETVVAAADRTLWGRLKAFFKGLFEETQSPLEGPVNR